MRLLLRLLSLAVLLGPRPLPAEEAVTISSVVFNGYVRERQSDRTFKPEFYVFGEGGCWSRAVNDPAMDRLNFAQIARVVAAPLANQNYLPAADGKQAGLLILVYWGATQGSRDSDPSQSLDRAASALADYARPASGPDQSDANAAAGAAVDSALWQLSLANRERDELDAKNARILGFTDALERAQFTQHMSMGQDVLQELGLNRYFVVLQAYDFPTARKAKKLKPLWTARLSVSEKGDFAQALEKMVWSGSRYFGRESDGLRRQQPKEGSVDLGPLRFIETVPPAAATAPKAKP